MRNIWFILRRDLKRLIINPAAWVIIFGLTFIPALYAWFNIIGFWNPYGNTKGITVAVANEDAGADNAMMGKLELGDQIESTLKENHELGSATSWARRRPWNAWNPGIATPPS